MLTTLLPFLYSSNPIPQEEFCEGVSQLAQHPNSLVKEYNNWPFKRTLISRRGKRFNAFADCEFAFWLLILTLVDTLLTSLLEAKLEGGETRPKLGKIPVSKVHKDKLIMKKEKLDHDSSKWDSDQVSHSRNLIG